MGKVVANMSMSLDGFVEDDRGGVTEVFTWLAAGDQAVAAPGDGREFRVSQASAEHLRRAWAGIGALVCGRRLFDLTHGWSGRHPVGCPVFVVTHNPPQDWPHPDAPFVFVTDGVASAVRQAQSAAGHQAVAIASAEVARQCLDLGLIDAIEVDLVPVLLGAGTAWFAGLQRPVALSSPTVVQGHGVTHLHYDVVRDA